MSNTLFAFLKMPLPAATEAASIAAKAEHESYSIKDYFMHALIIVLMCIICAISIMMYKYFKALKNEEQ